MADQTATLDELIIASLARHGEPDPSEVIKALRATRDIGDMVCAKRQTTIHTRLDWHDAVMLLQEVVAMVRDIEGIEVTR